ncbi:hypothetical protein ACIFUY_23945 [Streptomyces sp. CACIS-1.16CA]|uniref:hypothetical protein n=1 Tax=Streptomyces sp. CACIS-1.16CA TaxID=1175510 RepID=UPI0037D1FE8D
MVALLDALIAATRRESVEWSSTKNDVSTEEDVYTLSLTRGTVAVWSRDGDGVPPYGLQIRGEQGQVVEEYTSHQNSHDDELGQAISDKLGMLFYVASISARNANAVIDSMLDDLSGSW